MQICGVFLPFSSAAVRSLSISTTSRLNEQHQVNFKLNMSFPDVDSRPNLPDTFSFNDKNPFILNRACVTIQLAYFSDFFVNNSC